MQFSSAYPEIKRAVHLNFENTKKTQVKQKQKKLNSRVLKILWISKTPQPIWQYDYCWGEDGLTLWRSLQSAPDGPLNGGSMPGVSMHSFIPKFCLATPQRARMGSWSGSTSPSKKCKHLTLAGFNPCPYMALVGKNGSTHISLVSKALLLCEPVGALHRVERQNLGIKPSIDTLDTILHHWEVCRLLKVNTSKLLHIASPTSLNSYNSKCFFPMLYHLQYI